MYCTIISRSVGKGGEEKVERNRWRGKGGQGKIINFLKNLYLWGTFTTLHIYQNISQLFNLIFITWFIRIPP